jgi:transposase-like protein
MRELSVAEQRYQAVLSVIKDGRTVTETAAAVGVSRQTLHAWLAKYEPAGLEGLVDGSHRPLTSPQQMPATVEAAVLEARRKHPSWGCGGSREQILIDIQRSAVHWEAVSWLERIGLEGDQAARLIGVQPAQVVGQSEVVPLRGVLRRDCPDPVGLLFHRVGTRSSPLSPC